MHKLAIIFSNFAKISINYDLAERKQKNPSVWTPLTAPQPKCSFLAIKIKITNSILKYEICFAIKVCVFIPRSEKKCNSFKR